MTQHQAARHFGQRKASGTIVINSRGGIREYQFGLGTVLVLASLFTMFSVGYIGATAYLAFRDDLVASSIIRQARLKHEYEDRIAALRAKVDRITSRQMLNQQAVAAKVAELMRQQEMLNGQSGVLKKLFQRADALGIDEDAVTSSISTDEERSERHSSLDLQAPIATSLPAIGPVLRGSAAPADQSTEPIVLATLPTEAIRPNADFFGSIHRQVNQIENGQRSTVMALYKMVNQRTSKLAEVAQSLDLSLAEHISQHIGGPFIPEGPQSFKDMTDNLAEAFDNFETTKRTVQALPIGNPIPGASLSSSFGSRRDPFHGRSAFHSGLDFRASSGTPVRATASGKIVHAGRRGGYGLLVEIDHGNGITSRYAHLSRISVKNGQKIGSGEVIGRVGSTGRSTGPHLHYEVRYKDNPRNPARFLKAGKRLSKLL